MIFLKKKTWKYDIFFKCPEKIVFPKKSCWNMIFLVLSGKMVFFFREIWYFFFGRKVKDDLSQEIHENMIFLYICINVKNMISSWENTLKGDWHSRSHSRKSSNDSLCFYRDLHKRFHIFFCSKKSTGNLVYRIEIWLLLQLIWLEIFCNEEPSILCNIPPLGVVFRGVIERQLRKLFVH